MLPQELFSIRDNMYVLKFKVIVVFRHYERSIYEQFIGA